MRRVFLLFLFTVSIITVKASHFVGGDITWECISDPTSIDYGKFIFQLTAYGDCTGISFPNTPSAGGAAPYFKQLTVHGHPDPTLTTIDVFWVSSTDISPTGTPAAGNLCYDCTTGAGVGGIDKGFIIQEHIFRSLPISLGNGNIPDPTGAVWDATLNEYTTLPRGWHFTWGSGARNANVNMTSASSYLLRAVMYPYTKNTSVLPFVYEDVFPCYDSSPLFKEKAKTLMCTDVPFSYSHLAFDADFDSLAYSWDYPLEGNSGTYDPSNPASFGQMVFENTTNNPGAAYDFSVTQQIPTNPLIPLTLDEGTGEISFMNDVLQGQFLTCVRVRSVKCFQPIADVFREVQVVATDNLCDLASGVPNSPPDITSPVGVNQSWSPTFNPVGLPSYHAEVMAGDLVEFDVSATDIDMQDLTLEVEGAQLDLTLALSNPATFVITSQAPGIITGKFSWLSSCDHLVTDSCSGSPDQYFNFNLKAYDDFCPANGTTIANITINLTPPTPDLRCLSVESNGDVELNWYYPPDLVNAVLDYDVYFSKNINGPYNNIAAVAYPDSTYLHSGSGADTSSSFYYMITQGACVAATNTLPPDSISDTLRTIFIEPSSVLGPPIMAELDWNHMRINNDVGTQNEYLYNVPTTSDFYSVYYDVGLGFYPIIQTEDTIGDKRSEYCNYDPEFYVEIPDDRGCISRSNISSVHLADDIDPEIPEIKSVSVVNGKSVISWIPSLGAEYYAIYIQDSDGAWITIDTVYYDSSFVFNNSDANNQFETFSIRALDSCFNESLASYDMDREHNSIYLTFTLDVCEQAFTLNWNKYINWFNGLGYYKITVDETDLNGVITSNTFRLDSNSTEFLVSNLFDKYTYQISIEAFNFDSTFSARSNVLFEIPDLPKRPDYNYIDYASINHDDGSVEINCIVDKTAIIDHYDVFRSLRLDDNFDKIGSIPFDASDIIHYNDNTVATQDEFYQYEIYPVDTCGVRRSAPPVMLPEYLNDTSYAQTILLECVINLDSSEDPTLEGGYTNTLTFNEYDKWLGNVSKYHLYRSVNREPYNLIPLHTWDRVDDPDEPLKYIDIVTEFGDGNGRFCYYIHATEGNFNPYGSVLEGSFSNIACVSQTPIIFIPSVFTPNGDEHNEVFRPITYYVSEEGYSFVLYNRKGDELFSTKDPLKGWDGTFLGEIVQQGTYVYHLQFLNGIGSLTEKTGTITLVR